MADNNLAKTTHPLLESLISSPLLVHDASEGLFQASVHHIVTHERAEEMFSHLQPANASAEDDDDFWAGEDEDNWLARVRPYNVKDGILQIPVMGVLLNRFPYQLGRWATGYDYIEKAFQRGLRDDAVKGFALIIDSPGGEVAGNFELVDKIYGWRDEKPIRAFAADNAYSAAYSIASAADDITVTRSGGVGSIGVVTAHVDWSEAMSDMGVKVTFIHAGKHKVDGNPYQKLPESVKDRIQVRVDKLYGVFTSTVARNRGMDEGDVRGTEALTYDAEQGTENGLADKIGALEEEMTLFADDLANDEEDFNMAQNTKGGTPEMTAEALAEATATAKTEGHAEGKAEGHAEGLKEGAIAERERINAIIDSDEGKKRPQAAASCALKTGMSTEDAAAFLAGLPEEKAETTSKPKGEGANGQSHFDKMMEQDNEDVGAGEDDGSGGGEEAVTAETLLNSHAAATGMDRSAK